MSVIPDQSQAPSNEPLNFDDWSLEDLRSVVATGEVPSPTSAESEREEEGAAAPGAQEAAAPSDTEPTPQETEPAAVEETKPEEQAEEPAFKFTEGADLETFLKEKEAYLETVELTPELEFVLKQNETFIENLNKELVEAKAEQPATDQVAAELVQAFDKMLNFRQREDGKFVPDTTELVKTLEKNYPQETPQFVMDLVTMPSQKYLGLTRFQEFLRDGFELDDTGMRNLEEFLDNGGRFQTPSIVPEGIDPKCAEAFWASPDRGTMEDALAAHRDVINDEYATAIDKERATQALNQTINGINSRLRLMQQGLEAEKTQKTQAQEMRQQQLQAVTAEAEKSYLETSTQMLRSFGERIEKSLTMFEGPGAKVTALAYTTLIQQALADTEWSKYAQEDLEAQGIKFEWSKGRQVLDRLYDIEQRIAHQTINKANPRAIEIARREKTTTLKELKALETDLMGRIAKVAILGSNKALQTKVQNAPKQQVVRPRVASDGQAQPGQSSLDQMSVEQLRSLVGEARARRIAQGLPV